VVRDVNTINRYTEDVVEGNSRTIKGLPENKIYSL
jgi:hypothetical protein